MIAALYQMREAAGVKKAGRNVKRFAFGQKEPKGLFYRAQAEFVLKVFTPPIYVLVLGFIRAGFGAVRAAGVGNPLICDWAEQAALRQRRIA
jgi:hypothetical protein